MSGLENLVPASLITHLRRNAGGRALLLDDAMIARIVKHGGGDWRSTDAAFEKVALAVESGERIISGDDVTSILEEVPQEMTEVELFTEREDLEEIASRVISETLDHVYTGRDVAGVELNVPIPELSDDWEVPELTIEEKDELHEVLTSKNLTPHVTTTLTVDESDEFLVHRDDNLDALDQVRVAETTSSIDSITDQMFERMSNEHIEQSKKLAELEQEMFDLADRSRDASVEELIEIADRVGEIEVILGNVQEPPSYAMLTPVTVLTPIGEEA